MTFRTELIEAAAHIDGKDTAATVLDAMLAYRTTDPDSPRLAIVDEYEWGIVPTFILAPDLPERTHTT